jgi:hypothetical protein
LFRWQRPEKSDIIFDVRLGLSVSRKVFFIKHIFEKLITNFIFVVNGYRSSRWFYSRLECNDTSYPVSDETLPFIKKKQLINIFLMFRPILLTHRDSKTMVRNLSFTHNGRTLVGCNENGHIFVWTS